MIKAREVTKVKNAIIDYNKNVFRTKHLARRYGFDIQHLKHIINILLKSGFIKIERQNGRYTLYERTTK